MHEAKKHLLSGTGASDLKNNKPKRENEAKLLINNVEKDYVPSATIISFPTLYQGLKQL